MILSVKLFFGGNFRPNTPYLAYRQYKLFLHIYIGEKPYFFKGFSWKSYGQFPYPDFLLLLVWTFSCQGLQSGYDFKFEFSLLHFLLCSR